ncbi:hypothetical protein HanRHA438_Chr15g0686881 [Helianthus annuus]|nr:hypothetical protein HanRHA438_Chr15g0686881 [Helianthus annuus]
MLTGCPPRRGPRRPIPEPYAGRLNVPATEILDRCLFKLFHRLRSLVFDSRGCSNGISCIGDTWDDQETLLGHCGRIL